MDNNYRVVYINKLQQDAVFEEVAGNLSELFKIPVEKAEGLLKQKKPIIIKNNISKEVAKKYQEELSKIGLKVIIKESLNVKESSVKSQNYNKSTSKPVSKKDYIILNNSKLAVIGFWLLVPVILFVVVVKFNHLYPPKHIFKWIFLLPYISVILSIISLFQKNTKKTVAVLNLAICLVAYAPIGIPKGLNYINKSFSLNVPTDKYKTTPLHKAAKSGDLRTVETLYAKGVDINLQTTYGSTPLILASQNGRLEVVKYLLSKGATLNVVNQHKNNALTSAAEENHVEVVNVLIEAGANVNSSPPGRQTPLEEACWKGHTELFNLLISKGADINQRRAENASLLHGVGNLEIAKKLVEMGIDPNVTDDRGYTPLHWGRVDYKVAKYLIESGADVTARTKSGQTPLHREGNLDTIELLVKASADINAQDNEGKTPVYQEASYNFRVYHKLTKLLDLGADANIRAEKGLTALHIVQNAEAARVLIKFGADVHARTNEGDTPLHTVYSDVIAKELIENGADPNATNKQKQTPLHNKYTDKKKIYLIQSAGADVNLKDNYGRTPMYYATSVELVNLLVSKGLDPIAVD